MRLAMEGLVWMALGLGGLVAMAQTPTAARHPAAPQSASRASAQPSSQDAIVVRQTSFNIPFSVPATEARPVQIQLYVSADRGRNWRLYDQLPPDAGRFPFRAQADGEYWFALRTLDAQGRANPAGPMLQPGLRIMVDTREPELQFDATVGRAGEVTCTWRVSDPTLAPRSLKIEYQEVVDGPWKEMAVQRDVPQPAPNLLVGKTTWFPETTSRVIHVRAEVADRAGNKAAVTRRLFLAPWSDRTARANSRPIDTRQVNPAVVTTWPATAHQNAENMASRGEAIDDHASVQETQLDGQPPAEAPSPNPVTPSSSGTRRSVEELVSRPTYPPARSPIAPAVTQSFAATGDLLSRVNVSVDQWRDVLPEGELPKMIRQTQFQMDYDIESVGPEGVAEVQLWATTDGGRTWAMWQRDEDRRSPFDVHVPGEGLYGFCIVVVANNGLTSTRPRSGDLAELWVAVDMTPPEVRLTSAVYGEGRYAGQLLIRWEARDALLGDRPVTLLFSEHPEGPWNTVATGLANTGYYYWPVDPRIPDRVYLRIEVTDGAGNTSRFQLDQPVITAGLAPRGRILRLRTG